MKILHIAEFGKRASGIGTVVERLYKEQLVLGHDVRIVTIAENIAYKHLCLNTCCTKEDFESFLNNWKPEAVLFHSIWAMPYIKFAKVLKKNRIPYAVMMHGADSKVNRKSAPFKKWIANTIWFDNFMKKASAIVYLSQTEMDNCLSAKNNKNNVIIPNGCDQEDFDISRIGIHTPVNIIYLGRLAKYTKGIDILLDSLEILKNEEYSEVIVNFYANENDIDLQYLKNRLPHLNGIANYCGGAYGDKKKNVFKEADAFILTSRSEGMPMGVLEALSYGVPCILTPGTNMADDLQLSGAGWKAELNKNSVANKIKEAVRDLKHQYNMYHQSAIKLSANYDWAKIAQKHIDLMEKIANENNISNQQL